MEVTINGMRESHFGSLISQYAPEEMRDEFFFNIRVFIEPNGNFWFIGSEIASRMGYQNTRDALLKHVPEQYKMTVNRSDESLTVVNRDTQRGGLQSLVLISELGLYALAMKSKLPQAVDFQNWVYRVLSKIRQYGGYISPHPYLRQVVDIIPEHLRETFYNMRGRLNEQQQMIEDLTRQLDEQQPKVEFFDMAMDSTDGVPLTVIAKDFGLTTNHLHSILSVLGIIYRVKDTWAISREYQDQGYTASKSRITLTDEQGKTYEAVEIATYWTEKGRHFLYNNLMANGYKPLYLNK